MKWERTDYPGVYIRKMKSSIHGILSDLTISIRYRFNNKDHQEIVGRASKDNSPKKAFLILCELKANQQAGTPPFTLAEKCKIEFDRREAERIAKEIAAIENVSFKTFFNEKYLPIQKTHKPQATWIKEVGHCENWLFPTFGDLPLKTISAFHIERVKKRLLDENRTPRTIQHCLATFRQVWNHARREGVASGDSPTRAVKIPKFDNQRQRFLTDSECNRLLNELERTSVETYRLAVLSLDAGLRFSEAAGLTWGDVDTIRETILLRDTKAGHNRTVYMTGRIQAMFEEMERREPDSLIFPLPDGTRRGEVSDAFKAAVDRLGLNNGVSDDRMKAVFHTLRHTHASRLLESGADIYLVKTLLGHRNITTTERYLHVRADNLRSAVRNMERMNRGNAEVIPIRRQEAK